MLYILASLIIMACMANDFDLVSTVPLTQAAFVGVTDQYPGSVGPALLVTTFSARKDSIALIPSIRGIMEGGQAEAMTLTHDVTWPNECHIPPKTALNTSTAVIAGGFLVPGKSNGEISLLNLLEPSSDPVTISTKKKGYFYHHVVWHDVDGDGRQDILSARVNKPILGSSTGEMVWLKQPARAGEAWEEQVLFTGPDVWFVVYDVDGDGKMEIIATQFFTKTVGLVMYSCDEDHWATCQAKKSVVTQVIDSTIGTAFYVSVVDANKDGKMDLLVTNNNDKNGSVFAYEIPASPKDPSAVWQQHVLLSGFKPIKTMLGAGAPGNLATGNYKPNSKPFIIVSGDDNGNLVHLKATSEDPSDWSYTANTLYQATGTTGNVIVVDVNQDQKDDIIVAQYDEGSVQFWKNSM